MHQPTGEKTVGIFLGRMSEKTNRIPHGGYYKPVQKTIQGYADNASILGNIQNLLSRLGLMPDAGGYVGTLAVQTDGAMNMIHMLYSLILMAFRKSSKPFSMTRNIFGSNSDSIFQAS